VSAAVSSKVETQVAGLYFYGIAPPGTVLPRDLAGVHGAPVQVVRLGEIAALVSDLDGRAVVGLPAEVRDHVAVLDAVAATGPVLPVRFGTTVDDAAAMGAAFPAPEQRDHAARLRDLAGVVQLTVRARFVQDAVIAQLVQEEPEIRRLREQTREHLEEETYRARIRLGELVVAGFERKRGEHAEALERAAAPHVVELRQRPTSQVDDVAEIAVLVPRDRVREFEDALERYAARTVGLVAVRLVGPQAPYDFVEGA
jgi:hypothetical protein